ncbi:rhodanese-like domain-containing protein [Salinicola peritrichatus]|uniref:rhodanese-like domain-containing protein n=1 Tax=Salinicola peritrichatus TaxID=1267424 RepID=UPI001EF78148|nr:rhodanese-like domain-containing protein [Salinicola peritrichatus]
MLEKLRLHTDAWDLAVDLANGVTEIVVVDTRSQAHYLAGHIPGAINLPHVEMTVDRLASLDRSRLYISYCDGIGCNGSTWGAFKLASAGLRVKELLGGLDFWRRDGHPIAIGSDAGSLHGHELESCGC